MTPIPYHDNRPPNATRLTSRTTSPTLTITATTNHTILARAHNGTEWSALAEMTFSTQQPLHTDYTKLRVTKLMYAPTDRKSTRLNSSH